MREFGDAEGDGCAWIKRVWIILGEKVIRRQSVLMFANCCNDVFCENSKSVPSDAHPHCIVQPGDTYRREVIRITLSFHLPRDSSVSSREYHTVLAYDVADAPVDEFDVLNFGGKWEIPVSPCLPPVGSCVD